MRAIRFLFLGFFAIFLAPLAIHAAWWFATDRADAWQKSDWSSADVLPAARSKPEAIVHVYAGRVGRWRGVFAHHSWIVVKERGARNYTRFDKTGWGKPVKINNWDADARWYGHPPILIAAIEGKEAEALIPRVRAAVANYPYNDQGDYSLWPGPNSNSFVAYVLSAIPEMRAGLLPTAIGKDWRVDGRFFGGTPSGTGVQLSLGGLFGVTVGWVEGFEINVLGLVAGIDVRRPALKLPGFGRIGVPTA